MGSVLTTTSLSLDEDDAALAAERAKVEAALDTLGKTMTAPNEPAASLADATARAEARREKLLSQCLRSGDKVRIKGASEDAGERRNEYLGVEWHKDGRPLVSFGQDKSRAFTYEVRETGRKNDDGYKLSRPVGWNAWAKGKNGFDRTRPPNWKRWEGQTGPDPRHGHGHGHAIAFAHWHAH